MSTERPFSRRHILAGMAGIAALPSFAQQVSSPTRARLVVVGGGFGGATAAKYLKHFLPNASVTLIEPLRDYYACPFSNLVIGGIRNLSTQKFGYDGLRAAGVDVIQTRASGVDADTKAVTLEGGGTLDYDRLILSPGIDFRPGGIEGYSAVAEQIMPHAWKAGPQTQILRNELEAMEDGGLVVMSVPPAPFRCPPGPYERASLIAYFLKTQKPRSKLLILDGNDPFSKQALFEQAWAENYTGYIERVSASDFGRVIAVNASDMQLITEFDTFTADVANVIPPQKAGTIADAAGVTDATGWCPINPLDFSSKLQPDIHVIGDATIAAPMPKSAFSANLQAKFCAMQIARSLSGLDAEPTVLANTCYSFITPDSAISITGVYDNSGGQITSIEGSGGVSPMEASEGGREAEAAQAEAWFASITQEAFA